MMIMIRSATMEERETAERILKELEETHKAEIDKINAVLAALNKCGKTPELDDAEKLIRAAREPHIKALRTIRSATIVME